MIIFTGVGVCRVDHNINNDDSKIGHKLNTYFCPF